MFSGRERMAPDSGVQVVDLFLETAARPFLLASYAFLHALMENREHRGQLKSQIMKNAGLRVQVNNVWLLIQTLQLQYWCLLRLSGALMKTRPQMWHAAAAAQISEGERFIGHLFLGQVDQKSRTEHRVHMHNRFIFQHEKHRGLAAPLPFGLKMFEGGFHICNTQSVGPGPAVHL